jgi:mRNA-degrading endonuclease RelE of RelBE toxin-antitoxin system
MKIGYSKDFDKKVDKLKDKIAKKRLILLIEQLEKAKTLNEIPNTIPIKGCPGLFRIQTGDYRLIVERIKNNEIVILLLDYLIRNEKTYRSYK